MKHSKLLAEHSIKNEIRQFLSKYENHMIFMETLFMNTENSKTNELHKFSQMLDLRSSNKHVALQNVSIYYTWKKTAAQKR